MLLVVFTLVCLSTPFLWSCPKKRGGAPKKNAWGGGAPVRFRDPPASPTRVGGATRPLRCPLRGLISSLAAAARGWEMVKTPHLGRRFGSYLRDVEDAVPYRAGACLTRCAHTATHKRTSRETRSDRRPRRTANPIQNAAQGRRFHHFPPRPYWRTKMPPVGAAFLFIRGVSQKPRLFSRRTYRPPQGFFTRPFSAASSPCRNTALGRPRSCAPSQGL